MRTCHLCTTMNETMTVNHIFTRWKHKGICRLRHSMNNTKLYSLMYPGKHLKRPTLRFYHDEDASHAWLRSWLTNLKIHRPHDKHRNCIFANAYLVQHVLKFQPLAVGGFIHGDATSCGPRILAKRKLNRLLRHFDPCGSDQILQSSMT